MDIGGRMSRDISLRYKAGRVSLFKVEVDLEPNYHNNRP
jgi:hypothetical protein